MRPQITRVLFACTMVIAMSFAACAPKDADIEKGITTAIAAYLWQLKMAWPPLPAK
jgi:hypothetical protein